MNKIFFTSDLHFGHERVIEFDSRPYFTTKEMDDTLISGWNNKVDNGDVVYVLGDMFWHCEPQYVKNILNTLNGQIILIKGNHDRWLHNSENKKRLSGIKDYDDIVVTLADGNKKRCILSHYFIPFYNGHFNDAIHLHGHSHTTPEAKAEKSVARWLNRNGFPNEIYNVGCMYWNYEPVSLDEILAKSN